MNSLLVMRVADDRIGQVSPDSDGISRVTIGKGMSLFICPATD